MAFFSTSSRHSLPSAPIVFATSPSVAGNGGLAKVAASIVAHSRAKTAEDAPSVTATVRLRTSSRGEWAKASSYCSSVLPSLGAQSAWSEIGVAILFGPALLLLSQFRGSRTDVEELNQGPQ